MQKTSIWFTNEDKAKYPFLKNTVDYIRPLELQIDDLASIGSELIERAEERVNEALIERRVTRKLLRTDREIPSFPIALLIVMATENSFIKKRYALAEAKQSAHDLLTEPKEKVLKIACDFGWAVALNTKTSAEAPLEFTLGFTDYLRNAAHLHDKKWKLINSILSHGTVYLNQKDLVRLLEEEIRRRVEKRLDAKFKCPPDLQEIVERVKKLAAEVIGQTEADEMPKVVVQTAFPPCVNALFEAASSKHHLSHIGRFTLTSFLINIGMPLEKVNDLFKTFSDYNERLTLYQIEHIAGERGSGTHYTPPQCSVLQTHGVCQNKDDLCRSIYHPLAYYKRKQKLA